MKRFPVKPSADKQKFTRTAASTKVINISNVPFRGGIRF